MASDGGVGRNCGEKMRIRTMWAIAACFTVCLLCSGQTPDFSELESTPQQIVEQLWSLAMRGYLLTEAGWNRAAVYYETKSPWPGNSVITVMSNNYGVVERSMKDGKMTILMRFVNVGKIGPDLRFTPAPPSTVYETVMRYQLAQRHRHLVWYAADGLTKIREEELPDMIWEIESKERDLPWTTVNTAIRYLLEAKARTKDPVVQKNAEQSIARLLKSH